MSKDVAVRNNVVIVMCDLCVRYTTMVDRYIPDIAICLKDPEPFIRKQTLILLTNLLQVRKAESLSGRNWASSLSRPGVLKLSGKGSAGCKPFH